jgi:CheY-like chemotaxis protein
MKNDSEISHIPIVLFSANVKSRDALNDCNANDFIPKPFEIGQLLEKIEKHIA